MTIGKVTKLAKVAEKLLIDAGIRPELADAVDPNKGVSLVARASQVVYSIAELRLVQKTTINKFAFVVGYYTTGDGGGGPYALDPADTTTADDGGSCIVALDGGRWKLNVLGSISVKQFGAKGDNIADDTTRIQAAFSYVASHTSSGQTESNGLTTSYTGTSPSLHFPKGVYLVSAAATLGGYLTVIGEDAIIKQTVNGNDIFVCALYQFKMTGMQFVGGRNQLDLSNANINSSMAEVTNCQFILSRGAGIYTHAIPSPVDGTVWSHLSTQLNISHCRFIACAQTLINCCDNAVMDHCWIQPSKTTMAASTAVIINKGTSASDPNALTRLHLIDCFLIPDVGIEGTDRVNNVRWVDNYGSFTATNCRFGGEGGGMPIVNHLGAPNTAFPWNSTEVVLIGCYLFVGPDVRNDSCVMGILGHVPNRFVMRDCTGPLGKPIIANLSSTDLTAYFAAFETNSGKKAYEYFKIDIQDVNHDINAYTPKRSMIPSVLYDYLVKGRCTRVRKQTQSLANAFAANLVSFATVEFDNLGAFAIGNPTQMVMPLGASKMRIDAAIVVGVDGAAKTLAIDILDSGGTVIVAETSLRGINPDSDRVTISTTVFGPPTSYWTLRIRHNAAAALNLIDCRVTLTPTDLIA